MTCKPVIVVNFKTYKEATGRNALKLALMCETVAKEAGADIIVAVQEQDIFRLSSQMDIQIYAQHIDPISFGAHTGQGLPEGIKESGASGTLVNHSEHRLDLDTIKKTVERAKEVGLKTIVCAPEPELAAKVAEFGPDYIAIEPPELIGSETSVSTAKPEVISDTIKMVKKVRDVAILCGAGIKDRRDVAIAIKLGACGVLLSSHVVKAKEPEKVLRELAEGLKEQPACKQ
jgi:triosephosphate isomerase (TIM)